MTTSSGMPTWWNRRRLGIFVHTTVAAVPGFAPIGAYAEWYRAHLGEPVDDVVLHPTPLPEVLAHHRDRWGHVQRYDDFAGLLTFDRFDAEAWASLVAESGAGYTVFVAKHHDGWAWWDAPGSSKRLTEVGPRRNVLADYAAACERHDVAFGTYLSLLDWGDDRYPTAEYVDDALHAQAADLVERYGSVYLWGDGHWGHDAGTWRSAELVDRLLEIDPEIVVNDRWRLPLDHRGPGGATPNRVRTFEYDVPDRPLDHAWELCRGLGPSFGFNRTEGAEHQLTAEGVVALYTEVIAKGGHLLLNVGPAPDGTIPETQAETLRRAGSWIRRHATLLERGEPWHHWGDDHVRHLTVDGELFTVDVTGRGRIADLADTHHPVRSITRLDEDRPVPVRWSQDADGVRIEPPNRARDGSGPAVYAVELAPEPERISLFELAEPVPVPLAPLLEHARSGDVVQLGDGVYSGPVEIPPGVIVRGVGRDRTMIVADPADAAAESIRLTRPPVTVGHNARIEHLGVAVRSTSVSRRRRSLVELAGPFATVLGCDVAGSIRVRGDDSLIRASTAWTITADDGDRLVISRCTLRGDRWNVGIDVRGGTGHEVESCTLRDHLCAIRFDESVGPVVRGCRVEARWWAVHIRSTERAHVHGNQIADTMRAVDVEGGIDAIVEGNAVDSGDSGCVVRDGASGVVVYGNHWHGTRIGLLTWNADPAHGDNVAADLGEPDAAVVTGP